MQENKETFEEETHKEQTVLVLDSVKGEIREEVRTPTTLKKSDFKSKMYKYYKNLIGGNK